MALSPTSINEERAISEQLKRILELAQILCLHPARDREFRKQDQELVLDLDPTLESGSGAGSDSGTWT